MPASPSALRRVRRATLAACIVSALPLVALGGDASEITTARPSPHAKRITGTSLPVTSCDDAGPGTLRDVLALAQPGDTIDLSDLTCPNGEIVLTSNPIGTVVQDLEIHGPGQDRLTISGNDAHQILITFTGITISVV